MKKIICALLALLLLLPHPIAAAAAEEVPFLLSEHGDTAWANDQYPSRSRSYLDIDEGGQGKLYLHGYTLRVTVKEGNTYSLSAELSENLYTDPAYSLPLGEARLWTDGDAVRVEIIGDPYGIFSDCPSGDLVLPYQSTHREFSRYTGPGVYPSEWPAEQPDTDWSLLIRIGERQDVLYLHSDEQGLVRGTWEHGRDPRHGGSYESTIPCALLLKNRMAAVVAVEESGYGEALLFGKIPDIEDCNELPYLYTSLKIVPDHCKFGAPEPYGYHDGSKKAGYLKLVKHSAEDEEIYDALFNGDYRPVMGVHRILVDHYLDCGGWARMDPSKNSDTFWRYQKDGDTLVIVFDETVTDFGIYQCAVGYICYDADKSVKGWGGLKPLKHEFVDGYEYKKGESDFVTASGMEGYYDGENCYLYFTDDMRTVAVVIWSGDIYFSVDPILPA